MYFITNLIFCLTLFDSSFSHNDVIDYNCNLTNYSEVKFCNETKLDINYSNIYCLDFPLKKNTNCLDNNFTIYHIGKKSNLHNKKYKIKKSKKNKGVKLYKNINENEYESIHSGSGDIDIIPKSKKEKKNKEKKLKKGKVKKDKKLKKYYHLGYQNESLNKTTKDKKNNDITYKVVIIISSLLFVTLLFGSLFYAIKYRNENRNKNTENKTPLVQAIKSQNETELLIPKRDYQEI